MHEVADAVENVRMTESFITLHAMGMMPNDQIHARVGERVSDASLFSARLGFALVAPV